MSQIFLFTGENKYELEKERRRWVAEFTEKHGGENLMVTDAKSLSFSSFLDEVCTAPFIAERRLVVVDGIPKLEKDQLELLQKSIHPQVLVLFVEPKPDKRLSFTKELLKSATVKTFTRLRGGSALETWLCNLAKEEGSSLTPKDAAYLTAIVGDDQVLLANEVRKLATFASGRSIEPVDIEKLVILSTEQAGWQLMDLLAAGKKNEAMQFAEKLLMRGESPYALWNMFLWIVSQISLVVTQLLEGNTSPQSIAKHCGMHPNTARNLIQLARQYDAARLQAVLISVTDIDKALKTGGYRTTAESPEELCALLDQSIAAVA